MCSIAGHDILMTIMKIKITIALLLLIPIQIVSLRQADAQDLPADDCSSGDNLAYTTAALEPGAYDVFVRAGRIEDEAAAELYSTNYISPSCTSIGTAQSSISSWQKTGSYTVNDNYPSSFILKLAAPSTSFSGASSPSVLFVSKDYNLCNLSAGCEVEYKGSKFTLSPKKISMKSDTLKAGVLLPYADQPISKVIYNVDKKTVYTKKTLEPFNLNYVADGKHTLGRSVVLANGAVLIDKQEVDINSPGLRNTIVSMFYVHSKAVIAVAAVFLLLIAFMAVLALLRWIDRRRRWRQNHILTAPPGNAQPQNLPSKQKYISSEMTFLDMAKVMTKPFIIFITAVAICGTVITWVIGVFTVDGVSMYPTLQDKSIQPLVKFGATLANFNGNSYIPPRGTIVVVKKNEDNLFDENAEQQKSYVVKRVLGLPGERVVVTDSIITVYNEANKQGFVPDDQYAWVQDRSAGMSLKLDITLGIDELFVVGDNRDESVDSRMYGAVNCDEIVGSVPN